jgi:hypothetical protein
MSTSKPKMKMKNSELSKTHPAIQVLLGVFSVAGLIQIGICGYHFGQWIKAH